MQQRQKAVKAYKRYLEIVKGSGDPTALKRAKKAVAVYGKK
jgi:hypothetical protein